MQKRAVASVKTAFSVIGAIVGAGFITGREILSFFGSVSPFAAGVTAFAVFFVLFYFLLKRKNDRLFSFGNGAAYALSLLIMASMLSATDSLFRLTFALPKSLPIGSVLLLVLSTALCFCGLGGIQKANLILVPFMLIAVLVCAAYSLFFNKFAPLAGKILGESFTGVIGFPFSASDTSAAVKLLKCVVYCALNALLSQPFFCKIKSEKNDFSPALVSAFSAAVLGIMIFVYLLALNGKNAELLDIPVFALCGNNVFLKCLLCAAVFCAILTTQLSTEYPLIKLAERKKRGELYIMLLALLVFLLSRLGFYAIVDQLYPLTASFAATYYVVLICASLPPFRKKRQRRTSLRQARLKEG